MRTFKPLLILSLSAFIISLNVSFAEDDQRLPITLKMALEAYKKEGVDKLIPKLLVGSPIEGDKTVLAQANIIRQIEAFYGKYLNCELFRSVRLAKSTRLVYFILNYEKGPLYGVATAYRTDQGEIITAFNFHTEIHQIIPSSLILED